MNDCTSALILSKSVKSCRFCIWTIIKALNSIKRTKLNAFWRHLSRFVYFVVPDCANFCFKKAATQKGIFKRPSLQFQTRWKTLDSFITLELGVFDQQACVTLLRSRSRLSLIRNVRANFMKTWIWLEKHRSRQWSLSKLVNSGIMEFLLYYSL